MVLGARSPSLQYQIKLLEDEMRQGNTRPSNSKTRIATQILEDILPHTGVSHCPLLSVIVSCCCQCSILELVSSGEASFIYFET